MRVLHQSYLSSKNKCGHANEGVSCNNLYYPNNQSRRGQWIKADTSKDGKVYNCINRRDENPFKVYTGTKTGNQEDWLNLFKEGNGYQ